MCTPTKLCSSSNCLAHAYHYSAHKQNQKWIDRKGKSLSGLNGLTELWVQLRLSGVIGQLYLIWTELKKWKTNKEASVIFSIYYVRQITICNAAHSLIHFLEKCNTEFIEIVFKINYILIVFYVTCVCLFVFSSAMRNFFGLLRCVV